MMKEIKIRNAKGVELYAVMHHPPSSKPKAYAIFAHCFTCHSDFRAVRNISQSLSQAGIAVLRFDFTGLGKSEGNFSDSHFSSNIQDLHDVQSYLQEHYQPAQLLVGHSLGGAAALVAAEQMDDVEAVVSIGAPSSLEHVKHHFMNQLSRLEFGEEQDVQIAGRTFRINPEFIEDLSKTDVLHHVRKLRKPLLILHSPIDRVVGVEHARAIFKEAHHPKSYVSLNQADHLLSRKSDSLHVGQLIASWVSYYFTEEEREENRTGQKETLAHLDVVHDNFTTTVQTGSHRFLADEPIDIGGNDLGPSPYDLVSAGLASCTVMTLKMYAGRKEWPLEEVYAYVDHRQEKVQDENGQWIKRDIFSKKIELIGPIDEKQKDRLLEIAAKCPVHQSLSKGAIIESERIA